MPSRSAEQWLELGVALKLTARGSKLRGVIAGREVIIRRSFFGAVAFLKLLMPSRPAFALRRKGLFMPNTDPFPLEDPDFDACFSIEGARDHVFAALSAPVREKFLAHLTSLVAGEAKASFEYLPDAAKAATEIRHFAAAIDAIDFAVHPVSLALLEGMRVERVPEVMRHQFSHFLRSPAMPSLRQDAIAFAIRQPDPKIRLLAATAEAGHLDVLRELARDPLVPDNVRAQAVHAIPHAALDARELIELYARAELALRKVIASRLREIAPGPATEALLLQVLGEDDEELQIAAARSLAFVGTIAAIEPLRQCSKPALKSVVLKVAADAAIRAIKTRAEPNRGTLSLTELDERGALSISSERGALSVSCKEEDS